MRRRQGYSSTYQIPHVNLANLVLHEREVALEAAVEQVLLVRVPADPDVRMVAGVVEDAPYPGEARGVTAVHLDLDAHAFLARRVPAFPQGASDLLERLLFADVFAQAVRAHLHARAAEVARQDEPRLGLVDVLAEDGRVLRRDTRTSCPGRRYGPGNPRSACGPRPAERPSAPAPRHARASFAARRPPCRLRSGS